MFALGLGLPVQKIQTRKSVVWKNHSMTIEETKHEKKTLFKEENSLLLKAKHTPKTLSERKVFTRVHFCFLLKNNEETLQLVKDARLSENGPQ